MRSGTIMRAFDLRLGSAAPKGLLYDEILITYLIETARQSLEKENFDIAQTYLFKKIKH